MLCPHQQRMLAVYQIDMLPFNNETHKKDVDNYLYVYLFLSLMSIFIQI